MTTGAVGKNVGRLDIHLLTLVLILTTLGILLVFDASYSRALSLNQSPTKLAEMQAIWGVGGIVALLAASRIPYWIWRGFANHGILLSIIMLVAVFVPHIGIHELGSHRWIGHGTKRFQPSEFAKFAIVLFIARSCAGNPKIMRHFLIGPGPSIVAIGLLTALVALEPDLGTAALIAGAGFFTLFFAGIKHKHLAVVIVCAAVILGAYFGFKSRHSTGGYQMSRIFVFMHPEEDKMGKGFQVYHSLLALGTGGLTGDGFGQGLEKRDLPEANSDFIFAVIGEEGGLAACLLIITLYGVIVWRGMNIACSTKDRFGALMAAGISFTIGFQALINIAVVTASMPATGVPLPGISYGGSSLMLTLLMVGILLNIGRFPDGNPALTTETSTTKSERDFLRRQHGHGFVEFAPSQAKSGRTKRTVTRTAL
jgi:cell division protein FtsW